MVCLRATLCACGLPADAATEGSLDTTMNHCMGLRAWQPAVMGQNVKHAAMQERDVLLSCEWKGRQKGRSAAVLSVGVQHVLPRQAGAFDSPRLLLCGAKKGWSQVPYSHLAGAGSRTAPRCKARLDAGSNPRWHACPTPSPTPSLPPSFLHSSEDRSDAHHCIVSQRMHGTGVR